MNSRTWQLYGGLTACIKTNEKVVALTFDDGPTRETRPILHMLDSMDVKATFFVVGEALQKHLDDATMIVAHGHELGNHSYSHSRMIFTSYNAVKQEIESTSQLIRQAGYKGPIHFRPPYGKKLVALPHYLHDHQVKTIMWNVEPDHSVTDSATIVHDALTHVQPGAIILLHVMTTDREMSRKAVPAIIAGLKANGYRFVTVSQLLSMQSGG